MAINPPTVTAMNVGGLLHYYTSSFSMRKFYLSSAFFQYADNFALLYGILSVHGGITFTMLTSSFFFFEDVAGALG